MAANFLKIFLQFSYKYYKKLKLKFSKTFCTKALNSNALEFDNHLSITKIKELFQI